MPTPVHRLRLARFWPFALTLAASALPCPTSAQPRTPATEGQTTPPAAAGQATPAAAGQATPIHADDAIRYRVVVVAPPAVAAALGTAVDLVRWQDFAEMSEDLFDRLAREAVPQAHEAAATQGFFSANVDISVDRTSTPATVTLTITPGQPTRIATVRVDVTGPASVEPEGAPVIAALRDEWLLPRGAVFRQQAWTEAKNRAVATLAADRYAAARLTASEARIDPEAHEAALEVTIDSGPPFRFGDVEVQGLRQYTPELVRNFRSLRAGDPYTQRALDEYVRRLLASGYFASVQASIDTDPELANDARVRLSVIEAPTKRLEFGAGYSTDTEYRATASYTDVNINDRGMQFHADTRIETKNQQANARFVLPPTANGWIDSFAAGLQGTDIENLETRTASITARRRAIEERRTPAFGIGFYRDEQTPDGFPKETSHALYVDGEYTWRNVDNLVQPSRGWMVNVQAGAGLPGVSTEQFARVIGRVVGWWPLSRANDLTARVDAGAVIADSRVGIPSVFLFRTGGDTTVRGYAFESLGVQQGSAIVGGRYYAVASVEVVHWINETWGAAAFVDAGNATDSLSHFDAVVGYGGGARLRTPIGPFRLDVAYGQETKSVRVHFSVGLSF